MPSITPPTELDQLVALIAAQPGGMGIEAIAKLQGNQLTRRTLQRRLALLAKQGRIQMQGEARAVRYVCHARASGLQAGVSGAIPPQPHRPTYRSFATICARSPSSTYLRQPMWTQ